MSINIGTDIGRHLPVVLDVTDIVCVSFYEGKERFTPSSTLSELH